MAALEKLGGETWFRLGDGDLATHVERTRRLAAGESLSAIIDDFRRRFGIAARLLPMSDDKVRTRLDTDRGWLDFQDYFVRLRCEPAVRRLDFAGSETARPHPDFLAALADPDLRAVIICPSNPFISIDPILERSRRARSVARMPSAGCRGVADHRRQGGQRPDREDDGESWALPVDAAAVARHYRDFLDIYIADEL
jgi:LPPG:FO 2-phospho-L-lactate transferase